MRRGALSVTAVASLLLAAGLAYARHRPVPAPPFRVVQQHGVAWLTDPSGKPFFSSGVCCVTAGEAWHEYDPKRPGYAAWRQYPDPREWADSTVSRLKSWGFTTVGGWSDYDSLKRSARMDMPYTLVLHAGSTSGAP